MRRWWRGACDQAVVRNASTNVSASATVCMRAADADQLGVVVLAGQRRGLHAPRQRAPGAGHLVGRDLFAVAGSADDDAEALGVCDGPLGRRDAEGRVVVLGVVGEGAAVDRLVAAGLEVLDDGLLEFVSGMVRAEVDAHGGHLTFSALRGQRVATKPSSSRSSESDVRLLGGTAGQEDPEEARHHVVGADVGAHAMPSETHCGHQKGFDGADDAVAGSRPASRCPRRTSRAATRPCPAWSATKARVAVHPA